MLGVMSSLEEIIENALAGARIYLLSARSRKSANISTHSCAVHRVIPLLIGAS